MFGDHLHEMVGGGVWLTRIALVVVLVLMPAIVRSTVCSSEVNTIEMMRFRQEVDVDETDLQDQQQHGEHAQPRADRGGFCQPSVSCNGAHQIFSCR